MTAAPFAELATLAEALAHESSRLKKRDAIAQTLARVAETHAASLPAFALFLAGQPFAEADARKPNAGGALLSRAVKEISAATDAALAAAYRRHGDLGAAAYDLLAPPFGKAPAVATLSLADVEHALDAMARARSTQQRYAALQELLKPATPLEAKYLLKLLLGDMRIGVKQSLIEEAIASAATGAGHEVDAAAVRHAVMLEADLGRAAAMAFAGTLAAARMRLFHPLGFMLASPVETPEEAVARFTAKPPRAKPAPRKRRRPAAATTDLLPEDAGTDGLAEDVLREAEEHAQTDDASVRESHAAVVHALLEDKYDGMRAQLHFGDPSAPGRVAIYSRNREDITASFPELEEAFAHAASTGPAILDGEILGWDFHAARALPFAVLGQRIGRKRVDNAMRRDVPVVFMAFDVLFCAGELTLAHPLRERRALLERLVETLQPQAVAPLELDPAVVPGGLFAAYEASGNAVARLLLSPAQTIDSAEAIDAAYRDARARANEGVMLKAVASPYLPGRRGLAWLKLKRELGTLDVVITGAEFGHGRRAGLLSDYTFAVRGPAGDLLNVGKAYSGVTDEEIAELTAWLQAHTLEDFGHFRTVEPLRVLEVAFNNIMRSDRHASGFALRFPRILRVRDDKPVEEIDTLERVEELFQQQPDRAGE